MREQRFERWNDCSCKVKDNKNDVLLSWEEVVGKLNELSEMKDYFEKKKCEYLNKWNLAHLDNIQLRQEIDEQQDTIQKQSERIRELESIIADDIVRKSEIKDAWKQRTEKRWNDE